MSNDIMYVIFKYQKLKTTDIKQTAEQFCDIAIDLDFEFRLKIEGKESYIDSKELQKEYKKITLTIDCWDFHFEKKEEKKEYYLAEIERNDDLYWDFKWWQIAVLNTIMLDVKGEILWVAIDDGWYGYMYKIENGSLKVKEFPFFEVLKEGVIWGDKFKDVKKIEEHLC